MIGIRPLLLLPFLASLWLGTGAAADSRPLPLMSYVDPEARADHLAHIRGRTLATLGPVTVRLVAERDLGGLRHQFGSQITAAFARPGRAIVLSRGVGDLARVAAALNRPDLMSCDVAMCRLQAPLIVAPGAGLVLEGVHLRMMREGGAAMINYGTLQISDSVIEAWSTTSDSPARVGPEGAEFRPYISGMARSHTLIRDSRLVALGYQASMSYGLSFGTVDRSEPVTEWPSVEIVGNHLSDVYFGFYSFDADGVTVLANRIEGSQVYGIDPHDDTRDMLIADNYVSDSQRSHGIILSRGIHDSLVVGNTSVRNAGSGIFLDKASHDVAVIGNTVLDNLKDGIVLHECRNILVSDNMIHGNAGDGIRIRASKRVKLKDNWIGANGRHGVFGYDWTASPRGPNAEESGQIVSLKVLPRDNRFFSNTTDGCVWHTAGDRSVDMGCSAIGQ